MELRCNIRENRTIADVMPGVLLLVSVLVMIICGIARVGTENNPTGNRGEA